MKKKKINVLSKMALVLCFGLEYRFDIMISLVLQQWGLTVFLNMNGISQRDVSLTKTQPHITCSFSTYRTRKQHLDSIETTVCFKSLPV